MKFLFDMDSSVMRVLSCVADLVILNLLWLLCCLPVVTAGASTAALYSCVFDELRSSGSLPSKAFFGYFRRHLKKGTLVWLVMLAIFALLAFDMHIFQAIDFTGEIFVLGLSITVSLICLSAAMYLFPLVSQFESSVINYFANAIILSFRHPLITLGILALHALPFTTLLMTVSTAYKILIIWLAIGFAAIAYGTARLLLKTFTKLS